jgi:succinyl-diaminopimelate desuccinylase
MILRNNKKELIDKCLGLLNEQEIIDFTTELIKTKSFPPEYNEKDVALVVAKKLNEYGIQAKIDDLDQPNRANLIANIGSEAGHHLVFGGHFDTVPPVNEGWKYDPFSATIVDGVMYGRGTGDMKGGVASLVMAMCLLKKAGVELKGKLSYIGTAGEEVDLYGAKAYKKKYGCDDIDAMVIAEASNRGMFFAEKGALWLKFTSYGKAAHPGVAWEGINSLMNMLQFFEVFRHYDFSVKNHDMLGSPILNVTTMHAGTITNALPISCVATVDIRTVPGISHESILKDVDAIISELKEQDPNFKMDYEVTNNNPAIETKLDDPFSIAALQTHREIFGREVKPAGIFFYTDAVALPKSNGEIAPLIIYGPGNASNNHKVNESVEVAQLIDCTKFYIGLAINYLT